MNKYDNDSNRLLEELRTFPKNHQLNTDMKESIHRHLMNAANEYERTKKKKGAVLRLKSVFVGVAAVALSILIFFSMNESGQLNVGVSQNGEQTKRSAGKSGQEDITGADEEERTIEDKPLQDEPIEAIDAAQLKELLIGEIFLKNMEITGGKVTVEYYGSFDELKQANPDTELREADYKGFFSTADAIQKILTGHNLRLFMQFPALETISMTLPFEGKTYSIHLSRQEAIDYVGFNLEELDPEQDSWRTQFMNPYYRNEGGKRQKFFDHFVKVE
ncbi:MAG TPA: hypothetical protein VNM45_17390 [Bacillus sp. (in: firmicutes)]|nr:hypothetical protein [Bacillus sp. (in: firmicutes)]